ncbi:MAG: hypothetical protein ACKVP0_27680 [Pirellulaceae bacterium]
MSSTLATTAPPAQAVHREQFWKYAAAVAVVMWCLYGGTLGYPFLFDDHPNINSNPMFQDWDGIREILTDHSRPVAMLTFAANYAISENRVWSYHLTNIVIHAIVGLLLYGLVRRTLLLSHNEGRPSQAVQNDTAPQKVTDGLGTPSYTSAHASGLALAISLLFIVHPLQTQSVTYIVQRMESLMGLFFLLTLYAVVRAKDSARPAGWYLLAITSCWLGMGCKQVMVACPCVLLLYDRIFLANSWRQLWVRSWLHAGTFLSLGWLAWLSQLGVGKERIVSAGFGVGRITPWGYLTSQGGVILHYLRLTFWPDFLCLDYGWPVASQSLAVYPQCGVILTLLFAALWLLWKQPRLGLVAMSFFLILAPTSSFMPIVDLAFEQRMYLPLACVIILVVLAVHQLTTRLHLSPRQLSSLQLALVVLSVVALGARTLVRNRDYASEMGMWQLVARQRPENARAFKNLAYFHKVAGRRQQMLEAYEEALRLEPTAFLTWIDYGNVFLNERDFAAAMQRYRRATEECPTEYDPWVCIANVQAQRGEMKAALESCAKARSLLRKPLSRKEHKVRAWVLSTAADASLRNGREALELLHALQPQKGSPDIDLLDRFAAAYAEIGDFPRAIEFEQQAIRIGMAQKAPAYLQKEFAARLDLYNKSRPFRVSPESVSGTVQLPMPLSKDF